MSRAEILAARAQARAEIKEIMRTPHNGIPDNVQHLLEVLFPYKEVQRVGGPLGLLKLFGDPPVIGNQISAIEVFQRTGFGMREMKKQIKTAAEHPNISKRINVSYNPVTQIYTLVSMGAQEQENSEIAQ